MRYTGSTTSNKYTSRWKCGFAKGPRGIPLQFFGPLSWFSRPDWQCMVGDGKSEGAISVNPDAIDAPIDGYMYPTKEIIEYEPGKFTDGPVDLFLFLSEYAPGKEEAFARKVIEKFEKGWNGLHYQHPFWDLWLQAPAAANGLRRGYEAYVNSSGSGWAGVSGFAYGWGEFLFGGGLDGVPGVERSPDYFYGTNMLLAKLAKYAVSDSLRVGPVVKKFDEVDRTFDPTIDAVFYREMKRDNAGNIVLDPATNEPGWVGAFIDLDGTKWYRTADVMSMDEDGNLYFIDRTVDTIKHKGYRVSASEIESVLQEHPAVIATCVVGLPDEKFGERIKAYVVLKEDIKGITGYELIKWCRQYLVSYKVPHYIEFRDMLPKSKVGKLLRREIRDEEKRRQET